MITIEARPFLFWIGVITVWGPTLSTGIPDPLLWYTGHAVIALSLCWGMTAVFVAMMWVIGCILASMAGADQPLANYFYLAALSTLAVSWAVTVLRAGPASAASTTPSAQEQADQPRPPE